MFINDKTNFAFKEVEDTFGLNITAIVCRNNSTYVCVSLYQIIGKKQLK